MLLPALLNMDNFRAIELSKVIWDTTKKNLTSFHAFRI